jgi:hypothetical protein
MKQTSRRKAGEAYELLLEKLLGGFDKLSPQLQAAATFLIDRPDDVALLSMREQAKIAGVLPVTMTRLAQTLGFPGFDDLKKLFADSMRGRGNSFSSRSVGLLAKQKAVGDAGLVLNYIDVLIGHLERLKEETALHALVESANCLQAATAIYAVGLRSVFPVAFQFSYVQSYFSSRVTLLDGPGGIGLDRIQRTPKGSVHQESCRAGYQDRRDYRQHCIARRPDRGRRQHCRDCLAIVLRHDNPGLRRQRNTSGAPSRACRPRGDGAY